MALTHQGDDRESTEGAPATGWPEAIVDAWEGLIYIGTPDFRVRFMNRRFIAELGRDATGEECFRALHGRREPCPWCPREVFAGQSARGRFQKPLDGRWYDVHNTPLPLPDGRFAKVAFIREVSAPLPESRQLPVFRNLVDGLSDAIFFHDPVDGRVRYANDAACRNLGFSHDELRAMRIWDHSQAIRSLEEWRTMVTRIEAEGSVLLETRHRHRNGGSIPVEVSATVVQAGLQRFVASAVRDITERKKSEARLAEERNKVEAIMAAMNDGISVHDREFRIIYQNEVLARRRGRHLGEFCYRVYAGREAVCDDCQMEKSLADGGIHTRQFSLELDGAVRHLEATACPLRDAAGRVVACVEVVRNLTEQKKMEQELQVSNEKYRLLFSAESDAILTYDLHSGEIQEVNDAACRLYGLSRSAFGGKCWHDLVAEEGEEVLGRLRAARHRRGDGSTFPVEYSSGSFQWQGRSMAVQIVRDVTERQRLERVREEVVSVVSHEMRTPLTSILGFAEFLLENAMATEQQRDLLGRIAKEGGRLRDLIENLLGLQRLQAGFGLESPAAVELLPLLQEVADSFRSPLLRQRIDLDHPAVLPPVFGAENQLQQALKNLLGNAVKYAPADSTIRLAAHAEGEWILFSVKDGGPGIPVALQEKVFERFYRAGDGKGPTGTGLGLALVREIAQAHGGHVWLESAPGEGSTFYLRLPIAGPPGEGGESPG